MIPRVFLVGLVLVAGGAAFALIRQQQPGGGPSYRASSWLVEPPANYTPSDEDEYLEAAANEEPFPAGWVKVEELGAVTGIFTGLVDPQTNESQILVTVRDEGDDLVTATLYLNNTPVCVATRATGSIIERSGIALATLSTLVPANPPYTLEVRWVSEAGVEQSHKISL